MQFVLLWNKILTIASICGPKSPNSKDLSAGLFGNQTGLYRVAFANMEVDYDEEGDEAASQAAQEEAATQAAKAEGEAALAVLGNLVVFSYLKPFGHEDDCQGEYVIGEIVNVNRNLVWVHEYELRGEGSLSAEFWPMWVWHTPGQVLRESKCSAKGNAGFAASTIEVDKDRLVVAVALNES